MLKVLGRFLSLRILTVLIFTGIVMLFSSQTFINIISSFKSYFYYLPFAFIAVVIVHLMRKKHFIENTADMAEEMLINAEVEKTNKVEETTVSFKIEFNLFYIISFVGAILVVLNKTSIDNVTQLIFIVDLLSVSVGLVGAIVAVYARKKLILKTSKQ